MKRRIITQLNGLLTAVLVLGSMVVASAQLNMVATGVQTEYTPGATQTLNITVTNPTNQWIDRLTVEFPAGVTINSAGGPVGGGGCGTETAIVDLCSATQAAYRKSNLNPGCGAVPASFCGWWNNGTLTFDLNIDAGTFSGPMDVTLVALHETGAPTQSMVVTFAEAIPPTPCEIICPANLNYNLDPGACTQVVNYDVLTTGTCEVVDQACGFIGTFDPSSVDAWQVVGQSGMGPVPAGNNKVIFSDAGPACPAPFDQLVLRSVVDVGGFCYNGCEWDLGNTAPTTIEFDWTYVATSTVWDNFAVGIGAPGNGMLDNNNNFCSNFTGYWMNITNQFGPQNAAGHLVLNMPVNSTLSLAAHTNVAAGTAPCTITITNFVSTQIVPAELKQYAGLPSGSEFPIGTTTNCFFVDFPPFGNTPGAEDPSCCFDVNVIEFPNPIQQLNCNDLVNISLDGDCQACIGADDVLEGGPYHCYDDYVVELDKTLPYGNGPWVPACVGPSDIGKTYQVRVTDPETGNKCWGNVKIEDKLPPVLECRDYAIPCNANPNDGAEPAPQITGYQKITFNPNDPIGEPGAPNPDIQVYDFDYSYLPANTPVLDVNMRLKLTGHTWLPDLDVVVEAPDGTSVSVFTVGGCAGQEWPIDALFDDEGAVITLCVDLNCGGCPLQGMIQGVSNANLFNQFDGLDASGHWTVTISDDVTGDDGVVEIIGLEVLVDLPQILPTDGCGPFNLSYVDTEVAGDCQDGYTKQINRKWTAVDPSGNSSTCIQHIKLLRPALGDVVMPVDYDGIDAPMFQCTDNAYPTPQWIEGQGLQGYPWVFGAPEGCNINWDYEDHVIEICDGTYKIRREWTVIDWCVGDGFVYNQIVKVADNDGPAISCPANLTVSVDPFSCCAFVNLPDVIIEDNCSQINNISGMVTTFDPYTGEQTGMVTFGGSLTDFPGNNWWDLDTLGAFGWTPCLPQGTHTVTYIAEDDCGNTSTCTFRLTVRDYIPPVAACDETTTVAIGVDDPFDCYGPAGPNDVPAALGDCEFAGVTWVKATTFDDGSYDQCNGVKFTIRRMAPYSDCILGLNTTNGQPSCDDFFPDFPSEFERAISESDSIKFYCCEVGTTQTIVLRVYQVDINGNFSIGPDGTPIYNECMIQVEVQDKLKPVCVSPQNYTVTCEQFDPSLWLYGKASIYDNCCLDETKVYQGQCGLTHSVNYSQFDTLCNKGTIVRTFRAFDCHGQSSQCTQRIVVNYEQDYYVRFPNDVIVTVCDGTGNYGEPTFFGEDCELLGVSYEDEIFTVVPDACFKIERTWRVINWCTYDPNAGCVNVPNPNPNAIANHASNLPGPIVSPIQTSGDPWKSTIVKVKPTDPQSTNYSIFYDPNANCYVYKQIIKVIDTEDPIVDCPASPVTICDVTDNDPQLWNASYWWDNANQSHDLCEAPSDICITATDLCSGSNINIEYQLFLDLDGDGVMETVVNSTQLGNQVGGLGWNNIMYGNATGAGQSRQFDGRPVPTNQKWGFAIQETVSGTDKTACVKFNTFQSQNTFVTPQLPHGTHKIKWFVSDGCGNETICEYTIIIKDCKAPTVVCLNGLSVNIMPTGMIQLWATDFLQYAEDNCTLNPWLKYGIRKCGQGTGFPVDAQGNPITNVTFDCTELGTQCVELWAIDLAGNADYCETYVIVQDNNGNCPNGSTVNVSGALKTEMTDGVEEGEVNINGSVNFAPPFSYFDMSDNDGQWTIVNSVPVDASYTITPAKDDNPLNGVTTYDLVLISKHILGIEPLGSPYKMIAADANKSNSITTFDIVELRKLILGIYQELPNNTSWRFVDKSQVFANPANPFAETIQENISIAQALVNESDEDFVGVKIGDVNGSAVANSLMVSDDRSVGTLLFDVNDRDVKAGEEFEVSFNASEKTQGYQMTLNLNGLKVSEILTNDKVSANNFGVFADALTVSIDGAENFTVKFRAEKAGKLSEMLGVSSRITKAEAYTLTNDRQEVALRFDGKTIAGVGFELYQNQPNPFVNKTFVGFHLPDAATATLTVYDETGRVVFTQKGDFAKGYNAISLDRALLNTTGVLYYTLETATDSATKKMIQAK